jgi:hypothetical protein
MNEKLQIVLAVLALVFFILVTVSRIQNGCLLIGSQTRRMAWEEFNNTTEDDCKYMASNSSTIKWENGSCWILVWKPCGWY